MALTAKKQINEKEGVLRVHDVVASDIIYQGALAKINAAGYLAPCAAEAGAIFAGIVELGADNSSGSAGDKTAIVKTQGVFRLPISDAITIANVGDLVWATDDEDCTITEATNLQLVGRIVQPISADEAWVEIAAGDTLLGDAIESGEITLAEGNLLLGNSSAIAAALDGSTDAQMLLGDGTTVASVAMSGDITITNAGVTTLGADKVDNANIIDDAVSLEHLDAGITPSHIVVYAGEFTTAGGDTDETIAQAGIVATDLVHVTLHTAGSSPVTITDASAGTDQIDVDMSGDPSTDHVLTYSVLRAVA